MHTVQPALVLWTRSNFVLRAVSLGSISSKAAADPKCGIHSASNAEIAAYCGALSYTLNTERLLAHTAYGACDNAIYTRVASRLGMASGDVHKMHYEAFARDKMAELLKLFLNVPELSATTAVRAELDSAQRDAANAGSHHFKRSSQNVTASLINANTVVRLISRDWAILYPTNLPSCATCSSTPHTAHSPTTPL